jgi:hypothetical protein
MKTQGTYQITIKGEIPDHWMGWFDGTVIELKHSRDGWSRTELTCQVRDHNELHQILNLLTMLNLSIVRVAKLKTVRCFPVKEYGLIY